MPRRLPNPWVRAVVGGAAVVALSYLMGVGRYNGAGMGVITAAVVGYLCIRLLKIIADKGRFGFFAYYCWAVGLLTLILKFTR